jgi:hypothetical protein
MIVACIALFVALGGTATAVTYVVSANSQVGPNTISGHKPPSGKNANLIPASVNGQDVADNSLRGADIIESTLAKVPSAFNADSVNGKSAADLEGARAYAVVHGGSLCGDPVSFCPLFRSKGVAYAAHVSNGTYCVGVNGISATDPNALALVTPDVNSDSVWATWRPVINGGNVACMGREFEVQTGLGQNGVHADFTIVIP